jgi:hypothetical protein
MFSSHYRDSALERNWRRNFSGISRTLWIDWKISSFIQSVKLSPQFCDSSPTVLLWAPTDRPSKSIWLFTTVSSHFTFMSQPLFLSLRSRQRINDSDSIELYEHRIVVKGGSINTLHTVNWVILRLSVSGFRIRLSFWTGMRQLSCFILRNKYKSHKSIVFESYSHLARIELEVFYQSSLQSI